MTRQQHLPAIAALAFGLATLAGAQSKSPVLKDPSAGKSPFYLKVDRSTEALFDAFMLVKKANGGDPVAQHALGLRYLQGEEFAPDTSKAAHWISRAAARDYLPAVYNLGILKHNGWGTEWDPFGAYRNFRECAERGMQEGMYMTGILLTDNLVVARDYREAYRWISAAADSGNVYAREVLEYFETSGLMSRMRMGEGEGAEGDSASRPAPRAAASPGTGTASIWKPVFLDLTADTLADPDDSTIAAEALHTAYDPGAAGEPPALEVDSARLARIAREAAAGSPEALTFLGRRSERGARSARERIDAAFHYLRAIRCESRWAPVLLWRMSGSGPLADDLTAAALRGELKAAYVWAGLISRGFDGRLTDEQALSHLRDAARSGMPDALVELATWYDAGFVVPVNGATADSLMEIASALGSSEAKVRLMMKSLRSGAAATADSPMVAALSAMRDEGSVLAQVMLGYCHEWGRGVGVSIPRAVEYYRKAAQRGSRMAYDALRILYDARRPPGSEFETADGGE